jgi:hypothetical protein
LWFSPLRLELLSSEDSESPSASIWFRKDVELDPAAYLAIKATATEHLSPAELERIRLEDSGESPLWFEVASKAVFRDLLCEGEGQKLVDKLVTEFELLARFIPILNKIFQDFVIAK